jgi:hypothetical protein
MEHDIGYGEISIPYCEEEEWGTGNSGFKNKLVSFFSRVDQ